MYSPVFFSHFCGISVGLSLPGAGDTGAGARDPPEGSGSSGVGSLPGVSTGVQDLTGPQWSSVVLSCINTSGLQNSSELARSAGLDAVSAPEVAAKDQPQA